MTHPGLPEFWFYSVWGVMLILSVWSLIKKTPADISTRHISLAKIKQIQPVIRFLTTAIWPLLVLKIIAVSFFLLVIYAGLMGTPVAEKNIATVLTWNIWWAGLIVSVFFFGSAWCAVCPWDTLANWIVKPRLWFNKQLVIKVNNALELTPPAWLRNVFPALLMFIGLTWLELGVGVTTSPYWTALLSLLMVVLATATLAIYKNKAFCHYICPVGRTVGFYAQLAPVELRPINTDTCLHCTSLACFNGTDTVDACPTQLVMGRLTQNTYCTSCGNCTQSCPHENISWRLRPQSYEAIQSARPHWDEAWFMLALLALTSFHGITMMEFWEGGISRFAQLIGDSGQLLISFSTGLILSIIIPVLVYVLAVVLTQYTVKKNIHFKKAFTGLVFVTLPLAFAYHLAHNLNHMIRESVGVTQVFLNPLGVEAEAATLAQSILKEYNMLLSQDVLFALQAGLMASGFWIAIKVLRHRAHHLFAATGWQLMPMLLFILGVSGFNLWMLSQPMVMRLGALCKAVN